jgi:hypothetical protein
MMQKNTHHLNLPQMMNFHEGMRKSLLVATLGMPWPRRKQVL